MIATMTIGEGFAELQSIRNERLQYGANVNELRKRCDAVGHWAARQKNRSKRLFVLLREASELSRRLG
jgi:hypothetical protein